MKIVRFLGGLGNQMFQFAFYKALENNFKNVRADMSQFDSYDLHNGYELENIFHIKTDKASSFTIHLYDPAYRSWWIRKIRRVLRLKYAYREEKRWFGFESDIFEDKEDRLYWGYWQNTEYFKKINHEIRQCFQFKLILEDKNAEILKLIQQTESVSVHIRRGDYINNPFFGGICDKEYYLKALNMINEKVANPIFFIFSNDMDWCKENLPIQNELHYIFWNTGSSSAIDMHLMSNCKHNIIANSTFSWWAAWLNTNKDNLVISPANWTNDPALKNNKIQLKEWTCI